MVDYYHILGIKNTADIVEIKMAFRKLAVVYHPDKNPNNYKSKDEFLKIKEAYDVLRDPIKRKKYDLSLRYIQNYQNQNLHKKHELRGGKKDYSFSENQRKQRQEFAKKYQKSKTENQTSPKETIPPYNDFKYIMISIPLSIALLFLVINVINRGSLKENHYNLKYGNTKSQKKNLTTNKNSTDLITPTCEVSLPWDSIFGAPKSDSSSGGVFYIENRSGYDAIICLKDIRSKKVIRNNYVFKNNYFHINDIPKGNYQVWTIYGEDWDKSLPTTDSKVYGNFKKKLSYVLINPDSLLKIKKNKDSLKIVLHPLRNLSGRNLKSNQDFFDR